MRLHLSLFILAILLYLFIFISCSFFFSSEQEWRSFSNSAFSGHSRNLFLRLATGILPLKYYQVRLNRVTMAIGLLRYVPLITSD